MCFEVKCLNRYCMVTSPHGSLSVFTVDSKFVGMLFIFNYRFILGPEGWLCLVHLVCLLVKS